MNIHMNIHTLVHHDCSLALVAVVGPTAATPVVLLGRVVDGVLGLATAVDLEHAVAL